MQATPHETVKNPQRALICFAVLGSQAKKPWYERHTFRIQREQGRGGCCAWQPLLPEARGSSVLK
jgi:hypothetical protein